MARKHKLAAARAGKAQAQHPINASTTTSFQDKKNPHEAIKRENILVESEYECGYMGGVNVEVSDDEPGLAGWADSSDEESLFKYRQRA